MIWLAWRQHRKEILYTVIGLAVLAAVIIPTGLMMRGDFDRMGLQNCLNQIGDAKVIPHPEGECDQLFNQFNSKWGSLPYGGILTLFLPLLVGLFWGAPAVARELEQGTHRLVWTQGISRRRWAAVKFGLAGVVALVASSIYGLGMTWWFVPLSSAGEAPRFEYLLFDMQGVVPIGYTLFAIALGILAGTVWHKVMPAMAVTLAAVLGTHAAVTFLARSRYGAPEEFTFPVHGGGRLEPNDFRGDWVIDNGVSNSQGVILARDSMVMCPPDGKLPSGKTCGADLGIDPGSYNWILIQPADRFWLFQFIETGIYVGLAALLLLLAVRRIRRIA